MSPVNQASETQTERRRPLGALACVATGFEVVARNPELILPPVLLDLFLWLGPRLSVSPLLTDVRDLMTELMSTGAILPDSRENYVLVMQLLEELGEGFNLFSSLNPGPLLGVPALMPAHLSAMTPVGQQPAVVVSSFFVVMLAIAVLGALGLGLNAVFLWLVGRRVIAETEAPVPGPRTVWAVWRRFLQFGVLLYVLFFGASLAGSFVASLLGLISILLAVLVMAGLLSVVVFIGVHLMFTIPGMVQLRRGLFQAMKESLLLTRADFLNVVVLLGLVLVISRGLNFVWMLPEPDSWAALVGVGGHAFVSTALTAALFVFYQERLRYLEAMKQIFAAKASETPAPSVLGK